MAANRNLDGYDITSQNYFSELSRHIGKNISPVTRQSLCDARKKIDWTAFEFLHRTTNQENVKGYSKPGFHGRTTRAVDGTSLLIPHSKDLLQHFTQKKTNRGGKTHYPLAMLMTATNVYTGQVTSSRVTSYMQASERDLLISMLDEFKAGDLTLLDRGFWGLRVFFNFDIRNQFYICRLPSSGSRLPTYLQRFLKLGEWRSSMIVTEKFSDEMNDKEEEVRFRLIRGPRDSEGKTIVFATNLLNENEFPTQSILKLYRRRWDAETMYGRIKNIFHIENFHARTYNGVMQEIFAHLLLVSFTAILMLGAVGKLRLNPEKLVPSFKNAASVLRRYFFWMLDKPLPNNQAKRRGHQMLEEVCRILWKKKPGRRYTRVSHKPINRWSFAKTKRFEKFQAENKFLN